MNIELLEQLLNDEIFSLEQEIKKEKPNTGNFIYLSGSLEAIKAILRLVLRKVGKNANNNN